MTSLLVSSHEELTGGQDKMLEDFEDEADYVFLEEGDLKQIYDVDEVMAALATYTEIRDGWTLNNEDDNTISEVKGAGLQEKGEAKVADSTERMLNIVATNKVCALWSEEMSVTVSCRYVMPRAATNGGSMSKISKPAKQAVLLKEETGAEGPHPVGREQRHARGLLERRHGVPAESAVARAVWNSGKIPLC